MHTKVLFFMVAGSWELHSKELYSKPSLPIQAGMREGLSGGLDPRAGLVPFSPVLSPHVTKMDYF